MQHLPGEFDLMEKGEANQLEEAAENQLRSPWFTNLSRNILSSTRQIFRRKYKVEGRKTIVRSLEDCPEGYPRVAAFIDSDENFMLYRRFGFLQARIILYKQDELRELEEELDKMDNSDAASRPGKLKSRERDDADSDDRQNLIRKITAAFREYAELLKSARDLAAFNRPSARDYESVSNYFNMNAPLKNKESYIYRKEDIISIKPGREDAWLDTIVERILQTISCPLIRRLFCTEELRRKTNHKESKIILYSRARISFVVSLIITTAILVLLIIPVYLLWRLTRSDEFTTTTTAAIIGILLVFTLVFSGTLSLFTRAQRHEVLTAAAGYCAVLVVFISNISQLSPSTS